VCQSAAEESVQIVTSMCQWEMKVLKFKRYRDGYEDRKRPLEVEVFLAS